MQMRFYFVIKKTLNTHKKEFGTLEESQIQALDKVQTEQLTEIT